MIRIRPVAAADLDAVLAIQAASPEAAAWNRQTYDTILADAAQTLCRIAEIEDTPVGFAAFRVVGDEAELLNLAVLPTRRRSGIATQLMNRVLAEAASKGATDIYLEVRSSNPNALALYQRFGFETKSRRPGYYNNPPADALVLYRRLSRDDAPRK